MRIEETVKEDLDALKFYETETYSTVIKRLVEENKQLKEDKAKLYKIILKNDDAVGLANNVHRATFFIVRVVEDKVSTEEEKLQVLEHYLQGMLVEDPKSILVAIDILKDDDTGISGAGLEVLGKFENYVKTSS